MAQKFSQIKRKNIPFLGFFQRVNRSLFSRILASYLAPALHFASLSS
jgi:hypothetical protein